jgi:hypothetical protein
MDDFEKKESLKESNFYRRELVLRRAVILSEAQIATLNPICIRLKTIKFNRYHMIIGFISRLALMITYTLLTYHVLNIIIFLPKNLDQVCIPYFI